MKKIIQQPFNQKYFAVLIVSLLLITESTTSYSQPSWGAGPATATATDVQLLLDYADAPGDVEVINCDLYTDMYNVTAGNYMMAIVWDERDASGIWHVYAEVRNQFFGTAPMAKYHIASEARHPDVAFGDASIVQGQVRIGIVYENTNTNEVEYVEYGINGLHTYSTLTWVNTTSPYQTVSTTSFNVDPTHTATNPHIDALPTNMTWFTGAGVNTNYRPLRNYAVTWTEEDASGDEEIWVQKGEFNSAPFGIPEKVDYGTNSDVAGVFIHNTATDIAYVSYVDNSGDIIMEEFDITTAISITSNGATSVQTGQTIIGLPRIDAPNVRNTNNPPARLWAITSAVDISGQYQVRFYDDIGMTNFGSSAPYTGGADGYYPCVAIGPGPNDYNGLTNFGNQNFIHGTFIDDGTYDNIEATDYNISGSPTFGAYVQVSTNGIDPSLIPTPFAVGTSSNCGEGHITAWFNYDGSQYSIDSKVNTGNTLSFKPGKPAGVTKTISNDNIKIYPNPVTDKLNIQHSANSDYEITDATGRFIMNGAIDNEQYSINTSVLPAGVYLIHLTKDGEVEHLKFVKQ